MVREYISFTREKSKAVKMILVDKKSQIEVERTILGKNSFNNFLASFPLKALLTEYPSERKAEVSISFIDISSSITKTLYSFIPSPFILLIISNLYFNWHIMIVICIKKSGIQ